MTAIFLPDSILTPNNFNFGISVPVNQLKILAGMKDFLLRSHAWFMPRNFKRTLEISLSLVVQVSMKSKSLMEITCSNHALKSETCPELPSLLISATAETCSPAEEEMVSLESSTLSMMYESLKI